MKRAFDFAASAAGLLLLSPLLIVVAVLVKIDSRGPALFKQERIGKKFQPFWIYKFRSMVQDAPERGSAITVGGDPRITRLGHFLRKTKIDELPQLINVLKGDMSLVGPRPEVRRYVEMFRNDYEEILTIRPGITDFASLKYRNEANVLAGLENPEWEYVTHLLPEKLAFAKHYVREASFFYDLRLIFQTVFRVALRERP